MTTMNRYTRHVLIPMLLLGTLVTKAQSKKERLETGELVLLNRQMDIQKRIPIGTFLKIYEYRDSISEELKERISLFKGKPHKGQFYKIQGDTVILVHRGNLIYVNTDRVFLIKQFYSPFRRVMGVAVNALGIYGMTLGSVLAIAGLSVASEGEGYGELYFFGGLIFGGMGFFVHRLGLLLRRNRFDLNREWVILDQ